MKTISIKLKRSELTLCAIRFALIVGILVFTVTLGKSQTSNSIPDAEKAQSGSNGNSISTVVLKSNSSGTLNKLGQHAPEFNDPNYEAKKIEWIKNYPDEYNAVLKKTNTPIVINKGTTATGKHLNSDYQQKIAEHAPSINDPDYEAKKAEWINTYPQEYEQITNSNSVTTKTDNENIQSVNNQEPAQTISSKNNTSVIYKKMGEHAPDIKDPDFEAKKAAWIKDYPEEYEACLKNTSKTCTNINNTSINPVVNKSGIKVAEHAPDLNDPDYAVKKAAWIKNYPEEYNAVMNNSINAKSSINQSTPGLNQPVKKTSVISQDINTGNDATRANKNN